MRKMNYGKRFFAVALLAVLLSCVFTPMTVCAETPYHTYTVNGYGQIRQTQTAYLAHSTITKFGEEAFANPSDIMVTGEGLIYIADAGNSRIIVGNLAGELVDIIGVGTLVNPQGLFVTEDGRVYVADRDAKTVFVFDRNGQVVDSYTKPTSPLYGQALDFLPIKVVVNDAGILFVVCESNTNGIVEISPTDGGTFLGYFGTNFAATDLMDIIYRAILTDAQRAKMVSNIPATPTNLAIDGKGLIYTVTRGDGMYTLKRLNIAGVNMLDECEDYADTPTAVYAGYHDNVYVADQQGYIYEYNNEGEMLFVFGGPDDGTQRVGLSSLVSGIAIDASDRIYVLDADKCRIQVYQPTEFTNLLHQALYLYSKGRYTESKEPLTKVLQMNSMFDYANKAMGRAYFQEENYAEALHYARLAKDYKGYSDAYWEMRNIWLKKNVMSGIGLCILIWAVCKLVQYLDKKLHILKKPKAFFKMCRKNEYLSNLSYAGYFMKHPVDGSYGIAQEGRANWLASSTILLIFIIEYVVNKYTCGFIMKTVMDGRYEILSDVGTVALAMAALTGCTYLVCTINDGEGTVKKLYTFFCYSLMPYVVFIPFVYLLGHVFTLNEVQLLSMAMIFVYSWVAILVFLGLKEVNNFTVSETVKVALLTVFTALILLLLVFIIYVLWAQVFEFISAIFGEVVYRLGY